jgi:hypothetical protein
VCVCERERERETCGKLGSKAASSLDDDELDEAELKVCVS